MKRKKEKMKIIIKPIYSLTTINQNIKHSITNPFSVPTWVNKHKLKGHLNSLIITALSLSINQINNNSVIIWFRNHHWFSMFHYFFLTYCLNLFFLYVFIICNHFFFFTTIKIPYSFSVLLFFSHGKASCFYPAKTLSFISLKTLLQSSIWEEKKNFCFKNKNKKLRCLPICDKQ